MNTSTTIIGIVIIILCLVPFLLLSYNKKRRRATALKRLQSFAIQNGKKISESEIWDENVIGIADDKEYIFIIKKSNNEEIFRGVNLKDVHRCYVLVNGKQIKGIQNISSPDKIELQFTKKDKEKSDEIFEIYHQTRDVMLNDELKIAEKWCNIANECLKL